MLATFNIQDAINKVNSIDLSPINMKLLHESPERWDEEAITCAENHYKKFLTLHLLYGKEQTLVPNGVIDTYWHQHILDTRKYAKDCESTFGFFLHHDPYFGIGGEEEVTQNQQAFAKTQELWKETFGEEMLGKCNPCSATDCR